MPEIEEGTAAMPAAPAVETSINKIRELFTQRGFDVGGVHDNFENGVKYTLVGVGRPTNLTMKKPDGSEEIYTINVTDIQKYDEDTYEETALTPQQADELYESLKQKLTEFEEGLEKRFDGLPPEEIHKFLRAGNLASQNILPFIERTVAATGRTFPDVVAQVRHFSDEQIFLAVKMDFALADILRQHDEDKPSKRHVDYLRALDEAGKSKADLLATYEEIKDLSKFRVLARHVGFSPENEMLFEGGKKLSQLLYFKDLKKHRPATTEAQMLALLPQIAGFDQDSQYEALTLGLTPENARVCVAMGDERVSLHLNFARRFKNLNPAATAEALNEEFLKVKNYRFESQFLARKLGLSDATIAGLNEMHRFHMAELAELRDANPALEPEALRAMLQARFEEIKNISPSKFMARKLGLSEETIATLTDVHIPHMVHLESVKNKNAEMPIDELTALLRARFEEIKTFADERQFQALRLGFPPDQAKRFSAMQERHLAYLTDLALHNPDLTGEDIRAHYSQIRTFNHDLQFQALHLGLLPEDAQTFNNFRMRPLMSVLSNLRTARPGMDVETFTQYAQNLRDIEVANAAVPSDERMALFMSEVERIDALLAPAPGPAPEAAVIVEEVSVAEPAPAPAPSADASGSLAPGNSNQQVP